MSLAQHAAQARLGGENIFLQKHIDKLTALAQENGRLSNQLSQAQNASSPAESQSAELDRLRFEVGAQGSMGTLHADGLKRLSNQIWGDVVSDDR